MTQFFLSFLLLMSLGFNAYAEKKNKEMTPEMQAKMKAWQEAAAVNNHHKVFHAAKGKWNYTSKWWEEGQPAEVTKGKAKMELLFDGRFLQQKISGKAMGQKFEGIGYLGYDNVRGQYKSVWMDSMSTGVMVGTGTYDNSTKTLKDSGEYSDPTSPNKFRTYRSEWTFVDKNTMNYKMWTAEKDGSKKTTMEITYKRDK